MERDETAEPAASTQYDARFTVHNYTTATAGIESAELLSTAQRLVQAASTRRSKGEWVQVEEPETLIWIPRNLYAYSPPTPEVILEKRVEVPELKEWGSAVGLDEVWAMSELEEFGSADFSVVEAGTAQKGPRPSEPGPTQHHGTDTEPEPSSPKARRVSPPEGEVRRQSTPPDRTGAHAVERPGSACPEPSSTNTKRARSSDSEGQALLQATPAPEGRPVKRRKVDDGPLQGVIPRPHTFLTHMPSASPQPTLLKEYKRTIPIALAPYTSPLPEPSVWDRRAWIIPVRGTMPWANATGAAVLDNRGGFEEDSDSFRSGVHEATETEADGANEPLKPIPPAPRSLEPVFWTREVLRTFWEYLKVLRVDGKLGSLGITFHAAPKYRDGSIPSTCGQGNFFHFHGVSNRDSFSAQPQEVTSEGDRGLDLSSVDYIKVYHDAVKSMLLRTAIDIWSYQVRDDKDRTVERIRVLKGAKLVLLDHLSCGMMIS